MVVVIVIMTVVMVIMVMIFTWFTECHGFGRLAAAT
jgi:hypothetical protein